MEYGSEMSYYYALKKIILLLLLYVFSFVPVRAQIIISGKVNDNDGKPIPGVNLIFLNHEKKIKGFAISKAEGTYSVKLNSEDDSLRVTISKLGYSTAE